MFARQAVGKENRPSRRVRKPYDRPVGKPKPSALVLAPAAVVAPPPRHVPKSEARIPLRLPRPVIPPVRDLASIDAALVGVPISYIVARLLPSLSAFLVASSSYRPLPFPHPFSASSSSSPPRLSALPSHIPFHLPPQALRGEIKAVNTPDVCLVITGEKGLLVPAHRLVYASQCAHYPRASSPPSSPSSPMSPTTPIMAPETGTVMLPVQPLSLPSPSTFPLLHTALYHKSPWLVNALVGRNVSEQTNRELLGTLGKIHGLWSNVCALGVQGEGVWEAMGTAWKIVINTLRSREGVRIH